MQRAVDAGFGLAAAGERAIQLLQYCLDRERVIAQNDRLEALQFMRQGFEGRSHVRRRVRVALTSMSLVRSNAHDPAARGRGGAERKVPVLVLQRHHARLELEAFDSHQWPRS